MSGKENFQAVPSDMDYDSEEEYHDDIEDKHDIQERVDDSTSNVPTNELSPLSSFLRKDVTSSEYERVNHDSDDDLNALTETDTTFESEDDEDFVYSKEGGNYVDVDLNDDKKDIATNRQEIDENKGNSIIALLASLYCCFLHIRLFIDSHSSQMCISNISSRRS